MSTYNCDEYLYDAIESILKQDYTNFEFIIIDDCSTDRSKEILKNITDQRVKVLYNDSNVGLTKNLNKAIRISSGDYIARMDADDISAPDRFSCQINYLEENPDVAVCGTAFDYIINNKIVSACNIKFNDPLKIKVHLLFSSPLCHPSVMIRKSALIQSNLLYDENMKYSQDYALWVSLASKYNVMKIDKTLLHYRIHENNISVQKKREQVYCAAESIKKQFQSFNTPIELEHAVLINNVTELAAELEDNTSSLLYNIMKKLKKNNHSSKNIYLNEYIFMFLQKVTLLMIKQGRGAFLFYIKGLILLRRVYLIDLLWFLKIRLKQSLNKSSLKVS
jgi:glycosyltransferase involved in cell wall biosynthesis